MSKAGAFIVLIVAILSGLLASATVMKYIKQQQTVAVEGPQMSSVVVAVEKIPAGTEVRAEQVKTVDMPAESLNPGMFSTMDDVTGRYARSSIFPGEAIVSDRLTAPGAAGGLPTLIPEGYRAITLRVDDAVSVAGFVRPGHRVDILTTVDVEAETRETITKTILQNVEVIATGQELEDDESKPQLTPTVTVLVTLDQAERLTLAANAGVIRLVLRGINDRDQQTTEGVSLTSLIPQTKKEERLPEPVQVIEEPKEEAPKRPVRVVEVYRGAERSEVAF
ncbi:MAG: Flp pilus assembly protein CpaB [bacterium]|nr:Flp pilus assembly protein CpaB [bacterium]